MRDEDSVVCSSCGAINPRSCNQADCPMENYFWSLVEDSNE